MKETFANAASSTLAAAITTTGATTLTVASAAPFPTSGQFRILIDAEIMLVTAVSGTTFTVQRGIEGTTAATHASAAAVTHIVTAGSLKTYGRNNDPYFDTDRPPYGTPNSSAFTLIGTATITDQGQTINARVPTSGGGEAVAFMLQTAPATPYTVTASFKANCYMNGSSVFQRWGIGWRDSSGKLILSMAEMSQSYNEQYAILKYSSPTSYNSAYVARTPGLVPEWFKIADDGTNLSASISADGINWIATWTASRTDFLASPSQVGWFAENNSASNADLLVNLQSWQ